MQVLESQSRLYKHTGRWQLQLEGAYVSLLLWSVEFTNRKLADRLLNSFTAKLREFRQQWQSIAWHIMLSGQYAVIACRRLVIDNHFGGQLNQLIGCCFSALR